MTMMKKLLTSAVATAMMVGGAQAAISDNVVKIGYLADMSGTYRDLAGPNGMKALEMAIADFGGKVNGATIEVVSADDRNSADVASSTVRRWVENDKVDLVAGLVASSVSRRSGPTYSPGWKRSLKAHRKNSANWSRPPGMLTKYASR